MHMRHHFIALSLYTPSELDLRIVLKCLSLEIITFTHGFFHLQTLYIMYKVIA